MTRYYDDRLRGRQPHAPRGRDREDWEYGDGPIEQKRAEKNDWKRERRAKEREETRREVEEGWDRE